ncbi:MAG: tetratricopeptide repeat protein [Gemmatimonadota bacterium]
MSASDWEDLQNLLSDMLDRPVAERPSFIARVCIGRPHLQHELSELAVAHEQESLIDRSAASLLEPALPVLPDYDVLERLGQGGMGIVYRARDLRLGRIIALKFLPAHLSFDRAAKEQLRAEAQAAAALDHLNICTIYEIGEGRDGQLFIAMPYYDGETLSARLARGPLAVDEAIGFVLQAARGMAKAHERGITHRDIKPANLMITRDGVLKIVDFGIAQLPGVRRSIQGDRPGTVAYMSPEQVRADPLDGRTDVWSLGVVLYELLTGDRPFHGEQTAALIEAILSHPVAQRRGRQLPDELMRIVSRMLARDPSDRYTAKEVIVDLEKFQSTRSRPSGKSELPQVLPQGERRQLTILAAEWLPLDAALASAFESTLRRHGGTVNQQTSTSLVALFGVPMTYEDDPFRAVRAALEIHQWARGQNTGAGSGRSVHLAIHTASVEVHHAQHSETEYEVTESAVEFTRDLSRLTPPEEIWVSAECRRRIAHLVETRAMPPVILTPGNDAVVPFVVLGNSDQKTRLEAAERQGLTAFTGRETETGALQQALQDALRGEGRFVTVMGEAGMGKSRLLLELRGQIRDARAGLIQGRCEPSESGTTYLPFVEALRDWLREESGTGPGLSAHTVVSQFRRLSDELEEFYPLYLHLLGLPSPEYPTPRHLHGEHYRLAMQEALAAFVTLVAQRQPTALLLEDWHWADDASHGALQQIVELVTTCPLLVVVSCRSGHQRTWGTPDHHLPLSLDPLDVVSSGSMLRSILHVESAPSELIAIVHERAGGNPFFLEEIIQALLEDDSVQVRNGNTVLAGGFDTIKLPDTVQGVIRARLDRLDRGAREVLRVASVVGSEFTRAILEHVMEPGPLPRALQTLKAAGIIQQMRVVPEPAYRFKHVLTREAAFTSLLEHQRKELHGRVGEAIEALYVHALDEHLARLVEHFSRAEHWPKAVRYALLAAERTGALSQFAESLDILERAQSWLLRMPDEEARRDSLVEILFRQERLCETLGLRSRQQRIIDELVSLLEPSTDAIRLAEAYLRQGDLYTLLRRFEEAESTLTRALDLRLQLHDAIGERNTIRSLGLLRWHQGRDEEALGCIETALSIDRLRGDREAQVGDLANMGNVLKGMGQLARAKEKLEEALTLSTEIEKGTDIAPPTDLSYKHTFILHNLGNVHRELGDDDTALEYLAQARTLTTERRLPIQLSYHLTSTAHIYLQQGKLEESIRFYREAAELTRKAKFAPGLAQALRFLGQILLGLDQRAEALSPLVESAALFAQLREPATEALLWGQIAGLREHCGQLPESLAAWGKARALHVQTGDRSAELTVLEGLARVARRCFPEPSFALGYYGEAEELARQLERHAVRGRLRNAMGIIEWERGRYDEARAHYETGLGIFRDQGDRGNAAMMLASLGVTLNAMGRRVEARRYLEEAASLHHQAGDRLAEARALGALADVLRELGEIERAIDCCENSLHLRREFGDRAGEGWMLQRLALLRLAGGSGDEARAFAVEAERIGAELGHEDLVTACRDLSPVFWR